MFHHSNRNEAGTETGKWNARLLFNWLQLNVFPQAILGPGEEEQEDGGTEQG